MTTEKPRGRTIVSARALRSLGTGIAGQTARVPSSEISVVFSDDGGALHAAVVLPLALSSGDTTPIPQRADRLRRAMIDGIEELADRRVAVVDVRFAGVHRTRERRVR